MHVALDRYFDALLYQILNPLVLRVGSLCNVVDAFDITQLAQSLSCLFYLLGGDSSHVNGKISILLLN